MHDAQIPEADRIGRILQRGRTARLTIRAWLTVEKGELCRYVSTEKGRSKTEFRAVTRIMPFFVPRSLAIRVFGFKDIDR